MTPHTFTRWGDLKHRALHKSFIATWHSSNNASAQSSISKVNAICGRKGLAGHNLAQTSVITSGSHWQQEKNLMLCSVPAIIVMNKINCADGMGPSMAIFHQHGKCLLNNESVYAAHFTSGCVRHSILSYNVHALILLPWWSHVTEVSGPWSLQAHPMLSSVNYRQWWPPPIINILAHKIRTLISFSLLLGIKQPSFNFVSQLSSGTS